MPDYATYLFLPFIAYVVYSMLTPTTEHRDNDEEVERVHEESIAMSKYSLALLYEKQEQYDKALHLLDDAELIFEKHKPDKDKKKTKSHAKQLRDARKRIIKHQ